MNTAFSSLEYAPVEIQPAALNTQYFHGKVFRSDFMENHYSQDFVLPIGPSAELLACMAIRRLVDSVLDLGAGCGVQGILAADHARRVVATDINPRALELTRLNARLNGVSNIQTLQGSYFDPVDGQRFDMILANMPYVITPQRKYLYRDTVGNDSLNILHELPSHLQPSGFAHINLSWTYPSGQQPWQPILELLKNAGVDGMLFLASEQTPEQYAKLWLSENNDKANAGLWANWYRAHGMEHFALGHLVLRSRTSSRNWFTIFRLDTEIHHSVGERVDELFRAQDQLEALEKGDELLDVVFQHNGVQIVSSNGKSAIIRQSSVFGFKIKINSVIGEMICRFDGMVAAGELFTRYCSGISVSEYLHDIKLLIQFGMIKMK